VTWALSGHHALLLAAAVRDVFDPNALDVDGYTGAHVAVGLALQVDTLTLPDGVAYWSLRPSVRANVLRQSDRESVARALRESGPVVATERQRIFERWIQQGDAGAPGAFTAFLDALLGAGRVPLIDDVRQVAGWLASVGWVMPDPRRVLEALVRRELAERLQIATRPKFLGRERELALLGSVLDPASSTRIAAIQATGGMGKSSLIAQTMIERHAYLDSARVIVAFLDFDAATIDPLEPATLFAALIEQLLPQVAGLEGLPALLEGILAGGRQLIKDSHVAEARSAEDSRLVSFAHLLATELARRRAGRQVVVILDTMERALHGAGRLVKSSVKLLWTLLSQVPEASLILAGRLIPSELLPAPAHHLHLQPLSPDASQAVLVSLGVPPERARRAASLISGVPLTLRLAARVLREEGDTPLDDPTLRRAVERARVNGYLYRRVLGHLPDARLGKLADPGLMLRELTADAIVRVLGESVVPPVETSEQAEAILVELARMEDLFVSLKGRDPKALRVRPEIRGDLVALFREAHPEKFRAFHERAAAYYQGLQTRTGREAAAYHLLQNERISDVLGLLDAGVAEALSDALDELPARAAAWLHSVRSQPSDFNATYTADPNHSGQHTQANDEELKTEQTLREAEELERVGRPAAALARLLTLPNPVTDPALFERVLHLARVTGDAKRLLEFLDAKLEPLSAAIATEAVGSGISEEQSRRVIEATTAMSPLTSNGARALLAVHSAGNSQTVQALEILRREPVEQAVRRFADDDADLARRFAAQLGTEEALVAALEAGLLDRTRALNLVPALAALADDARAERILLEGAREDKLSHALRSLMSDHAELSTPIRKLLLEANESDSDASIPAATLQERAEALDSVADWLIEHLPTAEWTALGRQLVGSEATVFESAPHVAVRQVLYAVDRRGLTERLGTKLMARFPDAADLAAAFETLSDRRKAKA